MGVAARAIVCASVKRGSVVRSFVTSPVFCVKVESPYKHGKHRSDAEYLISQVPVIEVAGTTAICDGGSGALGHPIEYIQLNTVSKEPAVCKYCGLRFKMSAGPHHH
eukprot:GDKK01014627.1.p1 GENE.GDKK01014627.1~~GDKK01014627.1.p1  ORF type:complete len:107 (+),score=11.04 GDKK01014627.1:1-321(+)